MNTTSDLLDFEQTINPGNVKSAMRDAAATSRDLWFVPPADLDVMPGFNVRVHSDSYQTGIRELAESMKANGFYPYRPLAAIVVRSGDQERIVVTDGHRRLEAARLAISEGAPIEHLPVVISPKGTSMEDLTVALVQSNSGVPLSTYELAVVCARLSSYNLETGEIAKRLGKSSTYIDRLLTLMSAPRDLRLLVERETISATQAMEAIEQYGDKALSKLMSAVETAAAAGKTRVTAKHTAPTFKREVRKAAPKLFFAVRDLKTDPAYPSLSSELREKLEALLANLDELEAEEQKSRPTKTTDGEIDDE